MSETMLLENNKPENSIYLHRPLTCVVILHCLIPLCFSVVFCRLKSKLLIFNPFVNLVVFVHIFIDIFLMVLANMVPPQFDISFKTKL